MDAARKPDLRVITNPLHDFDGELTPENLSMLAGRVRELDAGFRQAAVALDEATTNERKLNDELKGKRLTIARLEADREADALAAPERPQVEALHALHAAATKANPKTPSRTKRLDTTEREQAAYCVKKLKFPLCLAAIVGIAYDPSFGPPRRNGTRECFNTFELALRNTAKASSFAERVPQRWEPNPERIAEITGLDVETVEGWLA